MEKQPGPSHSPVRRGGKWRRALAILCWAYLLATIVLWLLLSQGDNWWPATMLLFSARWLFALPLAVLLPAAIFFRRRSLVVVFAAAFIVAVPVTGFNIPWRRLTTSTTAAKPFRIMTINMHYRPGDMKLLEDLIARENPDVVAIQECPAPKLSRLRRDSGWYIHATPQLLLASRYPIQQVTELGPNSESEHASVSRYELETPFGVVHLFSLHTASLRTGISDTIHEKGKGEKGPMEVQANSELRRQQLDYVAKQTAECQGPVLLVGDFNTPPESTIFDDAWSNYKDAFSQAGWGCGYTFFGAKTMVRIDHIMVGKGWTCADCRVGPNVGSPHRPVIADLIWTGEP
jgi:vancomycin resistance protein VanJ